jgi:hypothetical protein
MGQNLDAFIAKWGTAGPLERADKQDCFILESDSVGVTHNPKTIAFSIESSHAQEAK